MARRTAEENLRISRGAPASKPLGSITNIEVFKVISLHDTFKGIYSVQFNWDGSVLAVGYGAGGIQLFNPRTGEFTMDLRTCRQGGDAMMVLRFHPTSPHLLYAASADGKIYIYNCNTGELLLTIDDTGNEINALDFSCDGRNFVTGGKNICVKVYDHDNKEINCYESSFAQSISGEATSGLTARVFCLKFHPTNQFVFLSGGWDNQIKIWDLRDGRGGIKRNIHGPHICGDALDIIDNSILSGQWTALHALQQFSYSEGKMEQEFKFPHKDGAFLYCAQYLGNRRYAVAGGSGTNSAEVMDLSEDKNIGGYKLECPVQALDTGDDSRRIAIGGSNCKLVLMNVITTNDK